MGEAEGRAFSRFLDRSLTVAVRIRFRAATVRERLFCVALGNEELRITLCPNG